MTPIEQLVDDHRKAALARADLAEAAFDRKAKAEIKAMAEVARRSLGQLFRYAIQRIAQR
jgi:hypothetical protein